MLLALSTSNREGGRGVGGRRRKFSSSSSSSDETLVSILTLASRLGNKDICKLLLGAKAEANWHSKCMRYCPLFQAVGNDHYQIVELLIEHGADVNIISLFPSPFSHPSLPLPGPEVFEKIEAAQGGGWTPLHEAASLGHYDCLDILLGMGANPSVYCPARDLSTPLHEAASVGDVQSAQLLVLSGADVNAKDSHGLTPLQYAATHKQISCVLLLLALGAQPPSDSLPHLDLLIRSISGSLNPSSDLPPRLADLSLFPLNVSLSVSASSSSSSSSSSPPSPALVRQETKEIVEYKSDDDDDSDDGESVNVEIVKAESPARSDSDVDNEIDESVQNPPPNVAEAEKEKDDTERESERDEDEDKRDVQSNTLGDQPVSHEVNDQNVALPPPPPSSPSSSSAPSSEPSPSSSSSSSSDQPKAETPSTTTVDPEEQARANARARDYIKTVC